MAPSRPTSGFVDRSVVGLGIIISGLVLILVSWLGVSGRAEVEEQVPWISLGIAGLVVLITGAALLAWRHVRQSTRSVSSLEADIEELHRTATVGMDTRGPGAAAATTVSVVPDGGTFHRADCRLVQGKEPIRTMGPDAARDEGLAPCPLCEPALAAPAVDDNS